MSKVRFISVEELIRRCLLMDRPAWEEFFNRYLGLINKQIRKAVKANVNCSPVDHESDCEEAFELVFKKLYPGNNPGGKASVLNRLENMGKIEGWLWTVVRNTVYDFKRRDNANKRQLNKMQRENVVYLDSSYGDDNNHALIDRVDFQEKDVRNIQENEVAKMALDWVQKEIEKFTERDQWVLRLKTVFYHDLSDSEKRKLAEFTGKTREQINCEIEKMTDFFSTMNTKKGKMLDSAEIDRVLLQKLERKLIIDIERLDIPENEKRERRDNVEKKKRRMEMKSRSGKMFILASNDDVARILNIENKNHISVIMTRIRKKLKEIMGTM